MGDQPHPLGIVQERGPDVASGGTTQRSIDRWNIQEGIAGTTRRLNGLSESPKCLGSIGGTIVRLPVVVLDLLKGQDVRGAKVVYNLRAEPGPLSSVIIQGAQVQHIVGRHGESCDSAGQPGRVRPEAAGE